ncbi:MAG: tetraacyldisaccharide 4'-kinase [Candidatus Omnitrophica bacterium]|nr:tetraacyldisaccharide 4'-kinase [Candidatus Omnitrophota bacterium]MCM8776800.1 tetraacyldisaccharide 4'-kinase [Candidatus Omnitrophota bacterium]
MKRCLTRQRKLDISVISVGNITAGGTGKTPLVMYIASFYQRYGKHIIVASSGAIKGRRMYLNTELGDEAVMVKKNFPDITITGKIIEEITRGMKGDRKDVIILDDGFHCHNIYKDMEVLVIDMAKPFDNNMLLPSGLLREPKRELKRADVFILSHPYMVDGIMYKNLIDYLLRFKKPIFIMDYEIESVRSNEGDISPDFIKNRVVIAFTGTGNPFNFFSLLSTLSPSKVYGIIYPDHFHYQKQDIRELESTFLKKGAEYLITTEKDYVKLIKHDWKVPLFYLKIKPSLKSVNVTEFDTLLFNII